MTLIKGITVQLINFTTDGTDDFGNPVKVQSEPIEVSNVLVEPTATSDVIDFTDLRGKKSTCTLAIPKGDTNSWEDSLVVFFGHTWKTHGNVIEGIEDMVPLNWHRKIMCERYE